MPSSHLSTGYPQGLLIFLPRYASIKYTMKTCSECHTAKPETDFGRNVSTKVGGEWEGKNSRCHDCVKLIARRRAKDRYNSYWATHDAWEAYKGKYDKKCPKCTLFKPRTAFPKNKNVSDGVNAYCKTCTSKVVANWMRQSGYNSSLGAKFRQFKKRNIDLGFGDVQFSYVDLVDWNSKQKRACHYCGCPEGLVLSGLWNRRKYCDKRTKTLTFDRKDNSVGYELNNLCLACDVCNTTKGNIFNEIDFIKIARKYIAPMWKELKKI